MIWSSKKRSVHEGRQYRGLNIADGIWKYLKEINCLETEQIIRTEKEAAWVSSLDSKVRIYFDASYNHNLGRSRPGIVVRSPTKEVLVTKQTFHFGVGYTFMAKRMACLEVVRLEIHFGFSKFNIIGEVRFIIIKSRYTLRDKLEIGAIIYDIQRQKKIFLENKFHPYS